jgi:hypothetical protein
LTSDATRGDERIASKRLTDVCSPFTTNVNSSVGIVSINRRIPSALTVAVVDWIDWIDLIELDMNGGRDDRLISFNFVSRPLKVVTFSQMLSNLRPCRTIPESLDMISS